MSTLMLLFMLLLSSLFFLMLINIKWFVATIRDIARDENGYTKLIQVSLTGLLCSIFLAVIIYYFINPGTVDRVDVILTVVVGWLGAIVGGFFSDKAMNNLEDKRRANVAQLHEQIMHRDKIILELMEELKK